MSEATKAAPEAMSRWRGVHQYAAPVVILLAIVVSFLRYHEYSLLLPESLALLAGAVALGCLLGAIGRLRPDTLGCAFIALALTFYAFNRREIIDRMLLTADGYSDTAEQASLNLDLIGVGLFLVIFVICIMIGRNLAPIVSAVFGTIALTTVVLPVETGGEAQIIGSIPEVRADLPPVVHIILDEHIGLDSLPEEFAESADARRAIVSTFDDFEIFSRAYSRFSETLYSLTSLINGNLGSDVGDFVENGGFVFTPHRNEWFDVLKRQGYAIQVYQTAWYNFCDGPVPVDSCYTYPLFSPNAMQRTPLSLGQRLRVLTTKIIFGTRKLQTGPLAATEALQQFSSDIERAPRGVAYILHLLMPHHDYIYRSDCTIADPATWEREVYGDDGVFSRDERVHLYDRYLGQLICANRRMEEVFARLKELGLYDEATIIVHGDHGSRNGRVPYIVDSPERYSDQDLLDNFATLLAIKAPGLTPGVRAEPVALQQLFAERFLQGEAIEPGNDILVRGGERDLFGSRAFVWPDTVDEPGAREVAAHDALMELRR